MRTSKRPKKRRFQGYGISAKELMITRIQGASLMAKRVFGTVAILAFILCPSVVRSDDNSLPENLLGFLKPGMHVGIQSVEGTTNVLVDIYTREQFQIAIELSEFGRRPDRAQEFASTHPTVQEKLDAFIEKLREESPEASADRVWLYPLTRRSFGTVSAVGSDYVLITREGEAKRRRVLAKSAIVRIDLDAESIQFRYLPPRGR